ncbi:hypothetical protein [Sodalis sp.]|uniref:hypothetical protein n=1 Tax=Sodalis sp. (in: enterobacteria) TaxID=1898979 RepID=UPI003872EA7E
MIPIKHNELLIIILITYLICIGNLTHIVVGSIEILCLVFNGNISWWQFSIRFNDLSHHRRDIRR